MNLLIENFWPFIVAAIDIGIATIATIHIVLHKRDSNAAVSWVGLVWLAPFVGLLLYILLGINRIQRRAVKLRSRQVEPEPPVSATTAVAKRDFGHLDILGRLAEHVTQRPAVTGNLIEPLEFGDAAYPAMFAAIDQARSSITMCTYIFDHDRAGKAFAECLGRAKERGVEVRVLVDDVGVRYSWPRGTRLLADAGINHARFLPTFRPWHFFYSNLRNHRKLLIVDGEVAFTGGMNIRAGNYREDTRSPIRDVHFRIVGPVVQQLQEVFCLDWSFTTGELLEDARWYPSALDGLAGDTLARAISDGPDEELDRLSDVIHGAISSATSRITVVTPYFLPDHALSTALRTASQKGIRIDVVLPRVGNLRLVQWASQAALPQLIECGVQFWLTAKPFDHTKIMIVDDLWLMFGSANWDARSLRINFELNVECYDAKLACALQHMVNDRIASAEAVTKDWIRKRSLFVRVRDGLARLASPYL